MDTNTYMWICKDTVYRQECQLNYVCRVCDAPNAHNCFGTIACVACKMFFRRHLDFDLSVNKCIYDGCCEINGRNRYVCRPCRYQKCLSVGMQKELTRPSRKSTKTQIARPVPVCTLDLLNNDRSRLTMEQWSNLSNVIHVYDDISPLKKISSMLMVPSSYPIKKRLKLDVFSLTEILGSIYRSVYLFLDRIPEFRNMAIHDQTILIERNVHNVGSTSGLLVLRDGDLYGNYAFYNANMETYGPANVEGVLMLINRLDIDGTLVKLLLVVLAFSTSFDVVRLRNPKGQNALYTKECSFCLNPLELFNIQNKYTDMMFIYMIYRYGYKEAAMRFAGLILNVLHLCVLTTDAMTIEEHDTMLNEVIEDTTISLATVDISAI